jgi:hypothetical protein
MSIIEDKAILKEIEDFYADIKRIDNEYVVPEDYIERYLRVTGRFYKPAHLNVRFEGESHE